jgi:type IV pilus assembly protein PilM
MRASLISRPWAGLDIGSFSIKLFALQPGMGRVRVLAAEVPYAGPAPANGDGSAEIVARAIAECAERTGTSLRTMRGITVGISGADVIVKQIQLPLMDEAEVGAALRFEARKHLPFDPQAMVIDHQLLGRHPAERRLDVLLAAVARDHLERHLAPLALLGVQADIVDATPLALTNAVSHAAGGDRGAHFLLDIGHLSSHLTLYQRGEPYFSRRLDIGGLHLTRAIAAEIKAPVEEAERWKLAAGSDSPGLRMDWSGRELKAVLEVLEKDLSVEVRRSLAFYRTLGHLPDPLRLLLSGGSARLPGIAERLANLLDFPVSVLDPFEELGGAARARVQGGPQFAQAVGLALRNA